MRNFILIFMMTIFLMGCGSEPSVSVTTEKVLSANDSLTLIHEGTIALSNSTEIISPVSGNLVERYIEDGDDVTEGQKLFKVSDFGPYTDFLQVKAELAKAMTGLSKAMSELQIAEKNASAQEIAEAKAAVGDFQKEIAEHQELIKKMEEMVSHGIIYAPKSGRLGVVDAPLGMLVIENETLLAEIGNINPVFVNFEISEAESKLLAASDDLKISLKFDDGTNYSYNGTFNNGVIFFENPDELLNLGTTAQIVIDGVKISNGLLLIPESVVQQNDTGNFVCINENNKAAVRKIQLGDKVGNYFLVKDGLKADDSIIIEGFQNLREGTPLNVTNNK